VRAVWRHAIGCLQVVVVVTVVLAACTNPSTSTTSGDASPDGGSSTPTDTQTDDGSSTPAPTFASRRFQTPSQNIVCQSFASSMTCVIHSGLVPEPSAEFCPVDWIGLSIEVGRFAGPACSGDPGIETSAAPEVPYGSMWSRSGVTCRPEEVGLTCRDTAGNGFSLASAGWRLIGKAAAARAAFDDLRQQVLEAAANDFTHTPHSVHGPTLRAGDDCDGMQQAFVDFLVDMQGRDDVPVIYEGCYVSGTWYLDGPLFPD
jgi:hypothetical protein